MHSYRNSSNTEPERLLVALFVEMQRSTGPARFQKCHPRIGDSFPFPSGLLKLAGAREPRRWHPNLR